MQQVAQSLPASTRAPLPRLQSVHATNGLLQIASGHRRLVLDAQVDECGTDGHHRHAHSVAVLSLPDARALIIALEAAVEQAADPASLRPVPLPAPASVWAVA